MPSVYAPPVWTEVQRLKLSSILASQRMTRYGEAPASDAPSLLLALVHNATNKGFYYANPIFVRYLYDDWDMELDTVRSHIDDLVSTGDVAVHRDLGLNCYGGTHSVIEIMDRRRFQRFSNRETIPKAVRAVVYERDGHRCARCGSPEQLSVDHIVPWSKGGAHDLSNFQTLCRPCNSSKGARA